MRASSSAQPDGRRVWYSLDSATRSTVWRLCSATTRALPELDSGPRPDRQRSRRPLPRHLQPRDSRRYVEESHELLSREPSAALLGSPHRRVRGDPPRCARPLRGEPRRRSPRSCSSACRTPAGHSSRRGSSDSSPETACRCAPRAPSRPTTYARASSPRWMRSASPLGGEFPKPLTDEAVRAADVVVTMGCGDACPVYPGRRYLDWDLEDPVGKPIAMVREIRDDIEVRVRAAPRRTRPADRSPIVLLNQ